MTFKVLNNYVAVTSVVSVRRVLAAAKQAGIDQKLLREVMPESPGEPWFGNRFKEIEWAQEGYASDNTIGILKKDVECASSEFANPDQQLRNQSEDMREAEKGF